MQTNFTAAQLADPDVSASEKILRACVHCGFCTATCPTYVLLGDELDSPRGRIYLIKDMLENDRPATPEVVKHIDRCLSCLSCMTTCPSGVNYMHLVDHGGAISRRHTSDRGSTGCCGVPSGSCCQAQACFARRCGRPAGRPVRRAHARAAESCARARSLEAAERFASSTSRRCSRARASGPVASRSSMVAPNRSSRRRSTRRRSGF